MLGLALRGIAIEGSGAESEHDRSRVMEFTRSGKKKRSHLSIVCSIFESTEISKRYPEQFLHTNPSILSFNNKSLNITASEVGRSSFTVSVVRFEGDLSSPYEPLHPSLPSSRRNMELPRCPRSVCLFADMECFENTYAIASVAVTPTKALVLTFSLFSFSSSTLAFLAG